MNAVGSAVIAVLSCLIMSLAVLKTVVWYRSVAWALGPDGRTYVQRIQADPAPVLALRRYELIEECNGDFWPLGAKSVRWQRFQPASQRRCVRAARSLISLAFINTPGFLAICIVFSSAMAAITSGKTAAVFATVITLWVALYAVLLLVEAIIWYASAKDYSLVWGNIKFSIAHPSGNPIVGDISALAGVGLVSAVASASEISIIGSKFQGFSGIGVGSDGVPIIDSLYYVLATYSTVGDSVIGPTNSLGHLGSIFMYASMLLTISIVIAAISVRVQGNRN